MKKSFIALLILSSCLHVSNVMQVGHNKFMITAQSRHYDVSAVAIQQATEFCMEQHKEMEIVTNSTNSVGWRGSQSTQIVFSCNTPTN